MRINVFQNTGKLDTPLSSVPDVPQYPKAQTDVPQYPKASQMCHNTLKPSQMCHNTLKPSQIVSQCMGPAVVTWRAHSTRVTVLPVPGGPKRAKGRAPPPAPTSTDATACRCWLFSFWDPSSSSEAAFSISLPTPGACMLWLSCIASIDCPSLHAAEQNAKTQVHASQDWMATVTTAMALKVGFNRAPNGPHTGAPVCVAATDRASCILTVLSEAHADVCPCMCCQALPDSHLLLGYGCDATPTAVM